MHFPPVGVALHWATNTFVPQSSIVSVNSNCTNSGQLSLYWSTLYWYIELPGSSGVTTFFTARSLLNSKGFYEMPSVIHNSETTIILFINNTAEINGSVLKCVNGINVLQATNIIVYGKA